MSARIFFAGATVGVIVGALAVVAFQKERAPRPLAGNVPTATLREETTPRSDAAPPQARVNDVQPSADVSVPAASGPGSTLDVAPASSSDPGDEVFAAVPMTDLQAAVASLPDESLGRALVSTGFVMSGDPKHPGQMIEAAFLRRADKPSNSNRR